ncbi:RadC family protein [Deferrisoma camini]|uniref:RadC family protein n=1 Tax=Deferrisoma camini TaxID=1035120 RepID=UPI00046CD644|nr:DNA repair protein RadC [Deferrisoma camini]
MGSGIRNWPAQDRPREKLLGRGAEALTDPELLAILLRTGTGGESAVDLARRLWADYGGAWHRLAAAAPGELAARPGLGPAKASAVLAALEIGRRMAGRPLTLREPFRASRQVYDHFAPRLRGLPKERFYCLLLDARNRLLREERVSEGTLTQSLVHPREAFRAAVREAASAVIFAHNHPSGDPSPSGDDRELTRRLWEAGRVLGIRVLDHVIVGEGRFYSFADEGEFPPV